MSTKEPPHLNAALKPYVNQLPFMRRMMNGRFSHSRIDTSDGTFATVRFDILEQAAAQRPYFSTTHPTRLTRKMGS